ncbi:MAG: tRNA pseudouridine(55) synthase TruB [Chloroflexota bacterium]
MFGVVNLDKPVGPTSHDMVDLVRRLTGMRRIGHAGTLDPLASGVLPILVGAATRFSDELTGGPKRYEAVIRLGIRSATDDGQGPLEVGGPPPDVPAAMAALASFVGTFEQRPPTFSARKVGGTVAHRAARAGQPVEAGARQVTVHSIDLLRVDHGDGWLDLRCDIRCGAGTYIRSIARDLGERLDCGGHLHALRRTEAAGLQVSDATLPDELERLAAAGRLDEAVRPVASLLHLPELRLDPEAAGRFVHGSPVSMRGERGGGRHAVFGDQILLGIGVLRDGVLEPRTVIAGPDAA